MTRLGPLALAAVAVIVVALQAPAQTSSVADGKIRIVRVELPPDTLTAQKALREEAPLLRGVRLNLTSRSVVGEWPTLPPGASVPPEMHAATRHVAERLACDGLLTTTARVIEMLGPPLFKEAGEEQLLMLCAVGLPTDLFDGYTPLPRRRIAAEPGKPLAIGPTERGAAAVVRIISRYLLDGGRADAAGTDLARELPSALFAGLPLTSPITLATEDGAAPARLVRMQLANASYWRGPGDGSAIDVAAQLVAAMPEADFILSTSYAAVDAVAEEAAATWPLTRDGQLTLVASPWTPQQWAQDNGKPGFVRTPDGRVAVATLVPRYASRGEERTVLDPAESCTIAAVEVAGHALAQTPLLFQGGNVLCVATPTGAVVLVGEAEIARNRALGLSEEQVIAALAELPVYTAGGGPTRVVVLPAVSFHIDMELCCRTHEGQVVALVNDDAAAARLIVAAAARALAKAGALEAKLADDARSAAEAGADDRLIDLIAPALARLAGAGGHYPPEVAEKLSAGPTDSGPANLERLLLAMDILAARSITPDDMPRDPAARMYIQALQRRAADRAALHARLRGLGWRVAAVPSLSDETRSVCYVNGFHLPDRYLMPAYGGVYAEVDAAAARAIGAAFGGSVKVVPILCGETQRRLGAIHCAASVYCVP